MTTTDNTVPTTRAYLVGQLQRALLAPIKAFRWRYMPLLMVYFAYGAMGLIAVAEGFYQKSGLTLNAAELAALGVWLSLPWAVKMVFGELVDSVALFGSQRRIYIFIGAALVAVSLLAMAGAASGRLTFAKADTIYIGAAILSAIGLVLQDVVADAMSTEVVARTNADGSARDKTAIDYDLGMVQALGRLALFFGILVTARLGGALAQALPYATVFLIGLIVPAVSVTGAMLVSLETSETRPTDWTILGGGIAFGAVVVALGLTGVPLAQELTFVVSLAVVVYMLNRVTADIDAETRKRIAAAALLIFVFRAVPGVGAGYSWFAIDKLGFDEAFTGRLNEISALLGLAAAWFLSDLVTRQPVAKVLMWLTILGTTLALPNLALVYELHKWSEPALGIGARAIAMFDAAAQSPLVQVSMIPLLTLTAIHAPPKHRATWFALMASLMNLALVAGSLATKLLNIVLPIDRGAYGNLPTLLIIATVIGFVMPMVAIAVLGRRVR